jgi:MoaA/NifB/PqqE/SkfB family radical SAM enzyme
MDSFCIYPFVDIDVTPNGGVKPCCVFEGYIAKHGRPMSVYEHTIEEIWDSDEMRSIRAAMVQGRRIAACSHCHGQEAEGVDSTRMLTTKAWQNGWLNPRNETIEHVKERAVASEFRVAGGPEWLGLDLGNLCNLKCRMCNSTFSSAIANDPVHAKWAPPGPLPTYWRRDGLVVAPVPVLGVAYDGFSQPDPSEATLTSWTYGNSALRLPIAAERMTAVAVAIGDRRPDNYPLQIVANGHVICDGILPTGTWRKTIALPFLPDATELDLRFIGPAFFNASTGQMTGIGIQEVRFLREVSTKRGVALSRFDGGEPWYRHKGFLHDELLGFCTRLTRLHLLGGEPLLMKDVRPFVLELIQQGAAEDMTLVISTNATNVPDEWLDLLARLKSVIIQVSLDGYGRVNDYIRYPSVWRDIEANLMRLRRLENSFLYVNATVQVYNMLFLPEIIQFCDDVGIEFRCHLLQNPQYLSPLIMPATIRHAAASRLRAFALGAPDRRDYLLQLIDAFEAEQVPLGADHLANFVSFTRELDESREQSIALALPELHGMMIDAGMIRPP